jgi:hypothetical protein
MRRKQSSAVQEALSELVRVYISEMMVGGAGEDKPKRRRRKGKGRRRKGRRARKAKVAE